MRSLCLRLEAVAISCLLSACALPHATGPIVRGMPDVAVVEMDVVVVDIGVVPDNVVVVPEDSPVMVVRDVPSVIDTFVPAMCGKLDQDCCAGDACIDGSACFQGHCVCGVGGSACCPMRVCNGGTRCVGMGDAARCAACGDRNQACCVQDGTGIESCNQPTLLCRAGVCQDCGGLGQTCCAMSRCLAGGMCDRNNFCVPVGGGGDCGDNGQRCCDPGGTCNAPNRCQGGVCLACGVERNPCCAGDVCAAGSVCALGTCFGCGGWGELCCRGGACTGGRRCYPGVVAYRCY